MKVLVVDDNPDNVYMLESLLRGNGYEVSTAVNGKEALEHLKQEPATLIISDILMPKMDGFQLCRAVKADDSLKNIPFIFYTATYTSEKDRDFALSLGASRFILKPADPGGFIGIIQEVLSENKTGLLKSGAATIEKETEYLKEHQARLIKKLGDKITELERSEERYRSLIACAVDAIITLDESGMITSWNEAAGKIFRYEPDEVLGKHFSLLVPEEPRSEQDAILRGLKEKKPAGRLEAVGKSKKGDLIPIGVSLSPMKDKHGKELGISAIIRDRTEHKRAEAALRESEIRYHLLFDQSPDGIVIIDPETARFLEFNETACRQLGYSRGEFARLSIADLEATETPEDIKKRIAKVMLEGRNDFETLHRTRQGEIRNIHVAARYTEILGRPVYHCVWRDITEHRKLEIQYLHAQKMESIGTLAGGVAHDFNNILSAIIGYGHVALMHMAGDDPQRPNIASMLEAADRAAHLTKGLLLFSRKQVSERRPVDLNAAVRKVEKFVRMVIGVDIECKIMPCDKPLSILADSHQLEQVLMNLAANARDAMPGGGSFTVLTEEVILHEDFTSTHGCGRPGPYAMITVSDTGAGMNEATRKRIFEPFFTTKDVGKGTGLGLAVVYGIIKQHDGFINVYSEPGKGTTFGIYLPIIAWEAAEETMMHPEEAPARGTETVLLAEDDDALRQLSRTVLKQFGYTVIEAVDGEDAVRKFIENKDTIHLLLFDLIMPKMNGKEAYEEILKIKPDMKVIFASGYAPSLVQQKVSLGNNNQIIYKPQSPLELLKKVRSVLDGADR